MTYQVINWNEHFENDRSRSREKCGFVCVPNKQHGMGFCRVMAESDGAAIYGIWHCIIGACSQQKKRDGFLTSDGTATGKPWGVEDLALKFRRPEKEIKRALEVLCSDNVGWLRLSGGESAVSESPSTNLEEKRREENEEKGMEYHVHARVALFYLNEKTGKQFRETENNLQLMSARLREAGVEIDGVKLMIERQCALWKSDPKMSEFLRPETLFGKTKFESYYAARNLPIQKDTYGNKPTPADERNARISGGTDNHVMRVLAKRKALEDAAKDALAAKVDSVGGNASGNSVNG